MIDFSVIRQSRSTLFNRIYIQHPSFFLIQKGEKSVGLDRKALVQARTGDIFWVAPGHFYTIRNTVSEEEGYQALACSLSHDFVGRFLNQYQGDSSGDATHQGREKIGVCRASSGFLEALDRTRHKDFSHLPDKLRFHQSAELLLWLKEAGLDVELLAQESLTRRIYRHVAREPEKPWRTADFVELLGMSEATLRRRLRQEGTSLKRVVTDVRLDRALLLLQSTAETVAGIAYACGFSSASHLTTAFKTRFDLLPREIR
ncbi:helix-turn-helix transcriptional regulator [Kiloniella sp. b19]|uniref:helix-turn-helix transcriptional regulator n=1 Tax=Kiloniella sp. GXU_MW_B19 TaxID=3141326 RepID=UPI0031E317E9